MRKALIASLISLALVSTLALGYIAHDFSDHITNVTVTFPTHHPTQRENPALPRMGR